jgi:hypothetical protein
VSDKIPVLITTNKDLRGVFFGFIDPADVDKESMRIADVQMAVYWCADVHGVLGLAAKGPVKGCRISKPAPAATIRGVTLVAECSPEAVKAWKSAPWST